MSVIAGLVLLTIVLRIVAGRYRAAVWAADAQYLAIAARFAKLFPGRCMTCSMHAYGVQHGHAWGPVEQHNCIERMWR